MRSESTLAQAASEWLVASSVDDGEGSEETRQEGGEQTTVRERRKQIGWGDGSGITLRGPGTPRKS
ncbi:hypothetical protein [Halorussus salinus]|uniref:hypothetical protein n=1 Tax=Halorussus salinus TaxID=1364935 RepID=UPI001092A6AA|nr:hypothetical protein [Halorussus salinus]